MATCKTCLGEHKRGEPHFPPLDEKQSRRRERKALCGTLPGDPGDHGGPPLDECGRQKYGQLRIGVHDIGGESCAVCGRVQDDGDPQVTIEVWSDADFDSDDCTELATVNLCRRCCKSVGRAVAAAGREVSRG